MLDSILKLIIGDMEEKRAYKQMMKRVDVLPKDYRFAFRKIQQYMFSVGPPDGDMTIFTDLTMFSNLIELLEISVLENRKLLDVVGNDVGKFCDEFMRASSTGGKTQREQINQKVTERFNKEG